MVTRGDRMLKRCGLEKARESENGCVYAGLINCSGAEIDAVLEIMSERLWSGRYSVIMVDQFAVEENEEIGLSQREARAVAVKIRELEKERDKTIRKRLRALMKNQRKIRRAAKRKTK